MGPAHIVGGLEVRIEVDIVGQLVCSRDAGDAKDGDVVEAGGADALDSDRGENVAAHQVRLEKVAIARKASAKFVQQRGTEGVGKR